MLRLTSSLSVVGCGTATFKLRQAPGSDTRQETEDVKEMQAWGDVDERTVPDNHHARQLAELVD
jgi:hypothetical protein